MSEIAPNKLLEEKSPINDIKTQDFVVYNQKFCTVK